MFILFSSTDVVDNTEEKVLLFIEESRKKSEGTRQDRGSYLAHLELIKQIQELDGSPCRKYGSLTLKT
jgi:hypothetical protein